MKKKSVYLDGAANTPVSSKVYAAIKSYISGGFCGNSHAIHSRGVKALTTIEEVRQRISELMCIPLDGVYFTSGATEANNWVIKSLAYHELTKPESNRKTHIVVAATEHSSVINACKEIEKIGFTIIYVQPNRQGRVTAAEIRKVLTPKTLLVCAMAVNNETGILNNVNMIGKVAHKNKSLFLADCTQALTYGGKYIALGDIFPTADYFTFSAHKIYGPTGVGCLLILDPKYSPIYPLLNGGGQESGLRGGTHNTAGIAGMGTAIMEMAAHSDKDKFESLYHEFVRGIEKINAKYKTTIHLNAIPTHKNILSVNCSSIGEYSDLASTMSLYGIDCSAGSACDTDREDNNLPVPSHVLTAMNIPEQEIRKTIRISFTRYTTKKDIRYFFKVLEKLIIEGKEKGE